MFLEWLAPSYLPVEARFSLLRKQRANNTLEWARKMPEFQAWQRSDSSSNDRLLWICATLGVGKSVMASYFVELLNCEYPDAFVGYFFCRTGEPGLTKADEIIRTLAYQFVIGDNEAKKDLDASRAHGKLVKNTGVGFLFERLLEGLLTRTKKQVFVIIDGLDEADCNDLDMTMFPARSEIEIFLQCLCALPIRVLLISRPDIFGIIPKAVTKRLTQNVNMKDIDTYIAKTIDESDQLKVNFKAHPDIDPFKYFHEKANGIFLWVVIVLHQLKQIQDTVTFNRYIAEFADASGDMWTLYARVLSKFENNPLQSWVRETLKWAVVTKGAMTIEELKEVVEWSLNNCLVDFTRFLEVECGALLDITPKKDGTTVHLIHETLRTFLINPKSCPLRFHVDEKYTHYHACCVCLDIICAEAAPQRISVYALQEWSEHLRDALESQRQCHNVLDKIYRFFHSHGCTAWIRGILSSDMTRDIDAFVEEPVLMTVWKYLQKFECDDCADPTAVLWRSEVMNYPSKLGEEIGNRAAQIWLYEDQEWNKTASAFRLALKYYCKAHGCRTDIIEDLQQLGADDFSRISEKFQDPQLQVKRVNLGIGFFVLRLWSEAIRCFQSESNVTDAIGESYLRLGEYHTKQGDMLRAIENFAKAVELGRESASTKLGLAYQLAGKFLESINELQKGLPTYCEDCSTALPMLYLARAYACTKNHVSEIQVYENNWVEYRSRPWWVRQCIAEAILANDQSEVARSPELVQCIQNGEAFVIYNKQMSGRPTVSMLYELDHTSEIMDAQFSQDGRYMATACNSTAFIYELMTGEKIASFWHKGEEYPTTVIHAMSFTPNAEHLLCALSNGMIAIWNIKSGVNSTKVLESERHSSCMISRDGRILISSVAGLVQFFDIDIDSSCTIRKRTEIRMGHASIEMAISADNKVLATIHSSVITLWNTESGTHIRDIDATNGVYRLAFSATGYKLASQEGTSAIIVRDLTDHNMSRQSGEIPVHLFREAISEHWIWNLSWDSSDKWIFSAVDHTSIFLWNIKGEPQFMLWAHDTGDGIIVKTVIANDLEDQRIQLRTPFRAEGLLATWSQEDCHLRIWKYS